VQKTQCSSGGKGVILSREGIERKRDLPTQGGTATKKGLNLSKVKCKKGRGSFLLSLEKKGQLQKGRGGGNNGARQTLIY